MASSFVARGLMDLVPELAVMLGANVGTAVNFGRRTWIRNVGRAAIGLRLMVLALHILLDTLAPAENAPSVRSLLHAITGDSPARFSSADVRNCWDLERREVSYLCFDVVPGSHERLAKLHFSSAK
jgi:Na+/phosphate symporter